MTRHLAVIHQSRSGSTLELTEAAVRGASDVAGTTSDPVEMRVLGAFDADADDVLWANGLLLATPAHFGYMSGALKDFFERIYFLCQETSAGLPYALIVKSDTDVQGAVGSVQKIATGLGWNPVLPPLTVVGPVTPDDREKAVELGTTLAAGLGEGIF